MRKYLLMCTIAILFSCTVGCVGALPFFGGKHKPEFNVGGSHEKTSNYTTIDMPEINGASGVEAAFMNKLMMDGIANIEEKKYEAKVKEAEYKAAKAEAAREIAESSGSRWKRYFYWAVGILGTLTILFPAVASIFYRRLKSSFKQMRHGVNKVFGEFDVDDSKRMQEILSMNMDKKAKDHIKHL